MKNQTTQIQNPEHGDCCLLMHLDVLMIYHILFHKSEENKFVLVTNYILLRVMHFVMILNL